MDVPKNFDDLVLWMLLTLIVAIGGLGVKALWGLQTDIHKLSISFAHLAEKLVGMERILDGHERRIEKLEDN